MPKYWSGRRAFVQTRMTVVKEFRRSLSDALCNGTATLIPASESIIIEGMAGTFAAMQTPITNMGKRAIGEMTNEFLNPARSGSTPPEAPGLLLGDALSTS